MKNVAQLIAKEQKELIIKALEAYQHTLTITMERHEDMGNTIDGSINHDVFDLTGLIGMMKYDVEVRLPKKHKDTFASRHGVDFPEYCDDIEADYPMKKDEWVTVMVGIISFKDDGVHVREASIQNLVSVNKHLRSQVDEFISDMKDDGLDTLIMDDYDGTVGLYDPNDERLFQTVDVCGSYTVTNTFDEVSTEGGYDEHYINKIDALGVSETLEVHKEEVYLIRIK
jgi:hypothetical protein